MGIWLEGARLTLCDEVAMCVHCVERGVVGIDEVVGELRPVDFEVDAVNGRGRADIKVDTKPGATYEFGNACVIATGEMMQVVEPVGLQT